MKNRGESHASSYARLVVAVSIWLLSLPGAFAFWGAAGVLSFGYAEWKSREPADNR